MNTKELRIGNFVKNDDGVQSVTALEHDDKVFTTLNARVGENRIIISAVRPIPLTEEWLLKLGFAHHSTHLIYTTGFIEFIYYPMVFGLSIKVEGQELSLYKHQYVHQLQNLYFALTGEELVINADLPTIKN